MFNRRIYEVLIVVAVVLALATMAFAFAGAVTFPGGTPKAGAGESTIGGYTVSNVAYTYDSADPVGIATVTFQLNAVATHVQARLVASGALYTCNNTAGNDWSCTISGPGVTVENAIKLEVLADNQ